MGLCNDNFWGYTTSILFEMQVRWIEAAIVNPYWTTMLIYYIEGDRGHLMKEAMGGQQKRTVVRGSACTYQMPWEEIVQELSNNVDMYPRCQDTLKYFVRVHLNVSGIDMKKYMREIYVRPFVLHRLIDYLIDSKHKAYQSQKDRVKKQVRRNFIQ